MLCAFDSLVFFVINDVDVIASFAFEDVFSCFAIQDVVGTISDNQIVAAVACSVDRKASFQNQIVFIRVEGHCSW